MSAQIQIITPLGPDALVFESMSATDELGRLSEYRIVALSDSPNLDPYALLGKLMTLRIELADGALRHVNAYVTGFRQVDFSKNSVRYEILAQPWLWFLTRSSDCRIFQKMKVPDIIREVFSKYPSAMYELRLSGEYDEWEYCVQYRESDFQFVSRLLEQEGIYYYFTHSEDKHTLILADSPSAHEPYPGYAALRYLPSEKNVSGLERVIDWSFAYEIQSGAFVIEDYDYSKPRIELKQQLKELRPHAESAYEVYDYPGKFDTPPKGENYVRIRMEEQQGRHLTFRGRTNARGIVTGCKMTLTDHPRGDQNQCYLVTSTSWKMSYLTEKDGESPRFGFDQNFSCIDSEVQYRSRRLTPKPVVQGPQTARVVGPAGEEIFTDAQARVKVHFHWDRLGQEDENSSCWLRVSYPMAGKGYGSVQVPRIGQEVIVDFLEGDPDRPIITGRVFNAVQTPPYAMPGMVSGMKSQTHKGKGFNAMSMDDTAGQEKIDLHAQHDMVTTVQNDQTNSVKNNRNTTVDVDDSLTVTGNRTAHVQGKLSETIVTGHEVTVTAGRTETVSGGLTQTINDSATSMINGGSTSTINGGLTGTITGTHKSTVNGDVDKTITTGEKKTVSAGKTLTVTDGGFTEAVTGERKTTVIGAINKSATETLDQHATGAATYTSVTSVTLGVGESKVEVTPSSITISAGGSTIKVDSGGVSVNGHKISLNC
jgi:type VI secretion system secreted protein VgrG